MRSYPECDFVSWDKPIAENCPKCEASRRKEVKKGVQVQCANVIIKKNHKVKGE